MSKRLKLFNDEDRITQLPDELLTKILSLLTLRQSGQTSLLSSRWKTLWTFTTGKLDLHHPSAESITERDALDDGRKQYATWVNHVTNSHKGGQIKGLSIKYDLDISYKSDLDTWIHFAVQNRSTTLEIDLRTFFCCSREKGNLYPFPKQVLSHSNIKLVTCFILKQVDFSTLDLQNIMSNCALLRVLSVSESETLIGGITVSGLNLLMYLRIRNCDNVEFVEISAVNLEVFSFVGPSTTSIRIHHAPILNTLVLGGDYCAHNFPLFPEVSSFFSQIETLYLDYSNGYIYDRVYPEYPEFKNLSTLAFTLCSYDYKSLLSCMSLFKKCPMLHTLAVGFVWVDESRSLCKTLERIELEDEEKLKCLKEVEFQYFGGRKVDVELVSCILENAPNVEEIIFANPCCEDVPPIHFPLPLYRIDEDARECARQLAKKHSPAARLRLLS